MSSDATAPGEVVALHGATVVEGGAPILADVTWALPPGAHAVVLGPNGAGKTTLLRLLSGYRLPSSGAVDVLGHRIGRVDVRALRRRIGVVSDALDRLIDRRAPIRHLVAAGIHAVTAPTRRELDEEGLARADAALDRVGMRDLGDRPGRELSAGEWQRALLARALVVDPDLLLLDEPCAGLDLAQREHFLALLDQLLAQPDGPATVLVTHHLEEVPRAVTHAVLLRDGRVTAAGEVAATLTDTNVSATYGLDVTVGRIDGRWRATA